MQREIFSVIAKSQQTDQLCIDHMYACRRLALTSSES